MPACLLMSKLGALREAHEEIGLPPDQVVVLGALPPRLSIAGFWVQVLVGRVAREIALRPDPREVDRILLVPVEELDDPERWVMRRPRQFPSRPGSPHFDHDGDILWGLTARFTLELLERIRDRGPFDR